MPAYVVFVAGNGAHQKGDNEMQIEIYYDNTAAVYEVFANGNWIGCFDTLAEAQAYAALAKEED